MPDDKATRGEQDRRRATAGECSEVSQFARTHGISTEQAQNLITRFGNDFDRLNAAMEKLTGKTSGRRSQPTPGFSATTGSVDATTGQDAEPLGAI